VVTAPVLTATGLVKRFARGGVVVRAVTGADLVVGRGEIVALVGKSGSGKSTLLSMLVGWERPDDGVIVPTPAGQRWAQVAVLPQALGLLDDLTIAENVLLPARALRRESELRDRAGELTERLGIAHLGARFPKQTSLGEQQRACLARAVLLSPDVVLADEPTSHQDARFTAVMFDLMRDEAAAGAAFLIASHDLELTRAADRVLRMRDGVLHQDGVAHE
jgi:putative ABC transport system ATP-binding protein